MGFLQALERCRARHVKARSGVYSRFAWRGWGSQRRCWGTTRVPGAQNGRRSSAGWLQRCQRAPSTGGLGPGLAWAGGRVHPRALGPSRLDRVNHHPQRSSLYYTALLVLAHNLGLGSTWTWTWIWTPGFLHTKHQPSSLSTPADRDPKATPAAPRHCHARFYRSGLVDYRPSETRPHPRCSLVSTRLV